MFKDWAPRRVTDLLTYNYPMYKFVKRLLDIIFSLVLIIALSPVFIILIIISLSKLGSPVFFCQERPGKDNKIFKLIKFRTMKNLFDEDGKPLPDGERMTKYGTFLRKSSLDELPEIFNILIGQMSFVGPRPLLPRYLHRYNETQIRRHLVKPGITGLAQVNGRNAISWEKKFEYDIEYVENISLLLDIKILFLTVIKVIRRDGISEDGEATMSEFMGDKQK